MNLHYKKIFETRWITGGHDDENEEALSKFNEISGG